MTWPLVKLDSIAVRGSGHTPSQKHPEYWNGGVKWVSLADSFALDRSYIHDTKKKISALGLRHSSAVLHPKGTVIVSRDAGVGKSAILGDEMAVSQHFIAWQCNEKKLNGEYLYQWLQSHKFEFERIAVGSTVKTIGLAYFEKLHIPLPPIATQVKIASVLADWDTAIERTERLIARKLNLLNGLRQEIFKGRSSRDKKTNWQPIRLREVLMEHKHLSTGKEEVFSVSVHKGLVNQVAHLGRSFAASNTSNYNLVNPGDIVYTKSPTGDFPYGIVKQSLIDTSVIVSPLYGIFSPRTVELGLLIDFYFESPINSENYLRPLIHKGAKNTVNITNSAFLEGRIELPLDPVEQKKLAKFIVEARKEILLLRKMKYGYVEQKRGLMQKLLTGQWQARPVKETVA